MKPTSGEMVLTNQGLQPEQIWDPNKRFPKQFLYCIPTSYIASTTKLLLDDELAKFQVLYQLHRGNVK